MARDAAAVIEWQVAAAPAGAACDPASLAATRCAWAATTVPGTAAGFLASSGRGALEGDGRADIDDLDWWWRGRFAVDAARADRDWLARIEAVATLADLWLDGEHLLRSENAFVSHVVPLGSLAAGVHELLLRCEALGPRLRERHPRGRWRSSLVDRQHLRWFRTPLLGRIPGWTPATPLIGPWRPVAVSAVADRFTLERRVTARCAEHGTGGTISIHVVVTGDAPPADPTVSCGGHHARLTVTKEADGWALSGELALERVERWWPHTHGDPTTYDVAVDLDGAVEVLERVGFRTLTVDQRDGGFTPIVNGVPLFCRGACWTPLDFVGHVVDVDAVRAALEQVRDAGFNMVRVGGTMVYESDAFHDACDELGVLVWQDVMLANFDPPEDPSFTASVVQEVAQRVGRLGGRPSLAVVCGGSEIDQQAAMVGLPAADRTIPLLDEVMPSLVARFAPGATYVPSTPSGGPLPFHVGTGVAHYYGVGAYLRPPSDARRAGVRFAAECLAFATPPDAALVDEVFGGARAAVGSPAWKQAAARDNAASWDFEDVRDHYVRLLFDVDPAEIRRTDPSRYLDLGRVAVGEVMAATFSEWRRPRSPCAGGLVWLLRDLQPGAGWGLLDATGRPKAPWWFLRRTLAPVAALVTDEGLDGLDVHVFNDGPAPLSGSLRIDLFGGGERLLESAEAAVHLEARAAATLPVVEVVDGFRDVSWAYRFGPPTYDVVSATLRGADGDVVSRAVHLPLGLGRPVEDDLGLRAELAGRPSADGWDLTVSTRRFAQAVVIDVDGYRPDDCWFSLVPDETRTIRLLGDAARVPRGEVRALNGANPARVVLP